MLSHVHLFMTPWTVAHQAPLSMWISRQEYWSGLPFPSPGDLPDPGIEPESLVSPALAGGFFTTEPPGKPPLSEGLCSNIWVKIFLFLTCLSTSKEILSVLAKVSRKQSNLSWMLHSTVVPPLMQKPLYPQSNNNLYAIGHHQKMKILRGKYRWHNLNGGLIYHSWWNKNNVWQT